MRYRGYEVYIEGMRGKTIVIVHGRQGCGDKWQLGKRLEWT